MATDISNLKDWAVHIDFERIAWAQFDREGESMNTLGQRPLEELGRIAAFIEDAANKAEVVGLIIASGKDTSFIAGADISDFDKFTTEREVEDSIKQVTEIFNRIERLRVPAVAAIHGFCLGGGLELAMACQYRIADREEGTRIGLPEIKLGLFPGLNGTVRALKTAGPLNGMQAMLTGRMLRPAQARAQGFVDELVPSHHSLRWAARKAVLRKRRSKGAPWWQKLLTKSPVRGYLAAQMRRKTAEKVRAEHYPAPFALLDLFDKFGGDPERMAVAETRAFSPLMVGETSRSLRRVFRLSEMLKAQTPKDGFKPLRAHVIGAGTMGGDIAAWCVVSGMEVSLQDMAADQIETALKRAKKLFKQRLRSKVAVDSAMARLIPDIEGKHVPRADIIIEAIVENLEIKQKVFKGLENRLKPGAVLATNTSSLPIEDIAAPLQDPGRLIGIHFFNPVAKMPLVEVVRGKDAREEEVAKGCAFVTAINKFPLIVKSSPGFLVNRVLGPYMFGAIERYQSGMSREKIDQAALKFGMPMGPLELSDVVGLDVCKHVAEILGHGAPDNSEISRLVRNGKLGKKTGEGFYVWKDGKPVREEAEFDEGELEALGRELIKPLLDECKKCLDEKIVENAEFVDAGVVFGTGFAPFRGGPLHYRSTLETGKDRSAAAA